MDFFYIEDPRYCPILLEIPKGIKKNTRIPRYFLSVYVRSASISLWTSKKGQYGYLLYRHPSILPLSAVNPQRDKKDHKESPERFMSVL
jgi:hypothetical protein